MHLLVPFWCARECGPGIFFLGQCHHHVAVRLIFPPYYFVGCVQRNARCADGPRIEKIRNSRVVICDG